MKIRFTSRAAEDLTQARIHYDKVDPELGTQFLVELDRLRDRLLMFPLGAPPVDGLPGLRRARVKRFPFGVFYRVPENDEIWILRVIHTRRDVGQTAA